MAKKKRGLNIGLDVLLADTIGIPGAAKKDHDKPSDKPADTQIMTDKTDALNAPVQALTVDLALDALIPGQYQPRKTIAEDELEQLADSIKVHGVLQPIIVRPLGGEKYEIIAGERRWRASHLAEVKTVPAVVKELSDEAALAIALIENMQREDLTPLEEALSLARLVQEFSLTHEQVARAVGKSRAAVTNLLRLLNLRDEVLVLLERGDIELGHAKVLLAINGEAQTRLARQIANKRLSVREAERLVASELQQLGGKRATVKTTIDPDVRRLQAQLCDTLGAQVNIMHSQNGKGKVIINYNSVDELEGILAHVR